MPRFDDVVTDTLGVVKQISGAGFFPVGQTSRAVASGAFFAAWGTDQWHISSQMTGVSAGVALGTDILRVSPWIVCRSGVLDTMQCELTVVGGAGSQARIGIYASDPLSLYPTALLISSASFAMDAGVGFKTVPIGLSVVFGQLLWLAYNNGGAAAPTVRTGAGSVSVPIWYTTTLTNIGACAQVASVFGALPSVFPPAAGQAAINTTALVGVKYGSVL